MESAEENAEVDRKTDYLRRGVYKDFHSVPDHCLAVVIKSHLQSTLYLELGQVRLGLMREGDVGPMPEKPLVISPKLTLRTLTLPEQNFGRWTC